MITDESREIFDQWERKRDARQIWDTHSREDLDFFLGNHFSDDEKEELAERAQPDVSFDRIAASVDQFEAMITSKPPSYSISPRESSDSKKGHVWRALMEYTWDMSEGDMQFRSVARDYSILGLGYFYAYTAHNADYGRGEIKFKRLNPWRVYVDPYAKHPLFDDASAIDVLTVLTKDQLLKRMPFLRDRIDEVPTSNREEYPASNQQNSRNTFTPANIEGIDGTHREIYRVIENFTKVDVMYFRVTDAQTGRDRVLNQAEMQQFLANPQMQQAVMNNMVLIQPTKQPRVQRIVTIDNYFINKTMLDIAHYPVIPVPNNWNETPYPYGDVRKTKDVQRFLNKMYSIIMMHAQTSANPKVMVPEGSVDDLDEFGKTWANPNIPLEYNVERGEPHYNSPQPLSQVHTYLLQQAESYIDYQFGIWELQHGNPEAAPSTAAGTMMMEDFGQRRVKAKLRQIEFSLGRLGQVIYNLVRTQFSAQKMMRIVQPRAEELTEEGTVLYDDFSEAIRQIKMGEEGLEDVRIVKNSTLPSNMWGEYQVYERAYEIGLVDRVEVLKKTDIFDKEGVVKRMSMLNQMTQTINSLQEYIKNLEGDLQTATRESLHDRKRVELEKFKTDLEEIKYQFEKNTSKKAHDFALAVDQAENQIERSHNATT